MVEPDNFRISWTALLLAGFLTCCQINESVNISIPYNQNPYSGKLKVLVIEQIDPNRFYNYTFHYDELSGQLINIKTDGSTILTISYITADSINFKWNNLDYPITSQEWTIKLNTNNKMSKLYLVNYFAHPDIPVVLYEASYDSEGNIESLTEPNIPPSISEVVNYGYEFQTGNCTHYTYQFYSSGIPQLHEVSPEYTSLANTKFIPRQKLYASVAHGLTHHYRYLDPLYILGMLDIYCVPRNQNLIHTKRTRSYQYSFDDQNRVNHLLEFIDGDSLLVVELEYY